MAGTAGALWQLAHDLHADESLGQGGRVGSFVRGNAASAAHPNQDRGGLGRQHDRQSPSRRHGRSKKNGPQAVGKSRGGWTTKIHMVATDARTALTFSLSPGQAHEAPAGRALLRTLASLPRRCRVIMDRAYEGNETRQLVLDLWASRRWFHRSRPVSSPGRTAKPGTDAATRSSGCSAGSKAFGESSADSTSSTSCSWRSYASPSWSRP